MEFIDTVCLDISGPTGTVAPSGTYASHVGVAPSPENFLVVGFGPGISGALVSWNGTVTRFAVDTGGWFYYPPAAAYDGEDYCVTWWEQDGDGLSAKFTRIATDGTVLEAPSRLSSRGQHGDVDIAAGAGRSLVVFKYTEDGTDVSGVHANVVLAGGSLLDTVAFPIWQGSPVSAPVAAHNGENFVVLWQEGTQGMGPLRAARVTGDGVVLDTSGVTLVEDPCGAYHAMGAIGDTALVVWIAGDGSSSRLLGLRLNGRLDVLDSVPLAISNPALDGALSGPAVTATNGTFTVTWSQVLDFEVTLKPDAVYRRVSAAGSLLDSTEVVMSHAANHQWQGDVASDGFDYLAVWADIRGEQPNGPEQFVYGARFSGTGTLLDAASIRIGGPRAWCPSVHYGAGCYVVGWQARNRSGTEPFRIEAARLDRDGVLLDTTPIAVAASAVASPYTDVAYCDSVFLVCWSEGGDLLGVRLDPAGVVLDSSPVLLEIGQTCSAHPRVASDGQNFLITRFDYANSEYRALRLKPNGAILDSTEILIAEARLNPGHCLAEVAYGGGVYLVVAAHEQEAWRVSPDGTVLDSGIPLPTTTHLAPHAVVFGERYFTVVSLGGAYTLEAVRVEPSGEVVDSTPFTLVRLDPLNRSISDPTWRLAPGGPSEMGIVLFTNEPAPYASSRARAASCEEVAGTLAETPVRGHNMTMRAFPVPAATHLFVEVGVPERSVLRILLYDVTGALRDVLHQGSLGPGLELLELPVDDTPRGVYVIRVEPSGAACRIVLGPDPRR